MIPRKLDLTAQLKFEQSAFLFGPRGTGKSQLSRQYLAQASNSMSIDLLRSDEYLRYLNEPWRLRQEVEHRLLPQGSFPLVVLLDEVQRVPLLLDEVHSLLETHPGRVSFLLTGSSARKLKRQHSNMLAGRARRMHLHPLSNPEIAINLSTALGVGTLPLLQAGGIEPKERLSAYVETYLKEEVMQEALVRRADVFSRFLEIAAQMNGEPINFAKIARTSGVSLKTAQEYFQILVDTMLVARLDGWSESVQKQLLQAPKFYFFDCGVLNALTGELGSELRQSSFRYGRLFETWVIQELVRANDYSFLKLRFNHWRTSTGQEVDCIVSRTYQRPLAAIEIKSSTSPVESDMPGLAAFASDYPEVPRYCLCSTPRGYSLNGIKVLPWQEGPQLLQSL
jgi:predicted AAA+ superfamily ATPase